MNDCNVYVHQGLLPEEVVMIILEKLPYEEISNLRMVNRQFNHICGQILNKGYTKAKQLHLNILKEVKDKLPRRESERRKHPLYPRHDVLQSLDTRLSLLHMTYHKYMTSGICCFIPGKVLDEIFYLLSIVDSDIKICNTTNLLREFRDISSMAMEHFEETTVRQYKEKNQPIFLLEEPWIIDQNTINIDEKQNSFNGIINLLRITQHRVKKQNHTIKEMKEEIIEMKKQIAVLQRKCMPVRINLRRRNSARKRKIIELSNTAGNSVKKMK